MKNTGKKTVDEKGVSDSILDAAEQCFSKYGTAKTNIADIADTANVSRATVYRYFKNRDAVLEGVMLRDAARLFEDMLVHIKGFDSTEERIVEALIFIMQVIEKTPRLSSILSADAAVLVASSAAIYQRLELFSQPLFNSGVFFEDLGKLRRDVSPDEMKEFLIQTVYGLLTLQTPASKSDKTRRKYLKTFVLPALME